MARRSIKIFIAVGSLLAGAVVPLAAASQSAASPTSWGGAVSPAVSPAIVSGSALNCTTFVFGPMTVASVNVPTGAVCALVGVTVTGGVVAQQGSGLYVVGSVIGGNLQTSKASFLAVGNGAELGGPNVPTQIWGNVQVTGTTGTPGFPSKNVICDSTYVGGSIQLTSNKAPVAVGTDPDCFFPGSSPSGDTVGRSVLVSVNTALVSLFNDVIGGSLVCAGNVPPPIGGSDIAVGGVAGQCA